MNKLGIWGIAILGIAGAFVIGSLSSEDLAVAIKPPTEVEVVNADPIAVTGSLTSDPACPAENVQHWNKIQFFHNDFAGSNLIHETEPDIIDSFGMVFSEISYEVIVQADPSKAPRVESLVAVKLNEIGYTYENGSSIVVDSIFFLDIEYSTICAEN